jgi:hypothetical protein
MIVCCVWTRESRSKIRRIGDRIAPFAPRAGKQIRLNRVPWDHSAATGRLIRTCVISARSAAGFTGLLSTVTPCARASSRTSGLRSAVIRMAVRSEP